MDFKTYKIGEIYQHNKYVPLLRFNGKWLEELDFNIGEQVIVYQGENMLVITKPSIEEQKLLDDRKKEKELKKLQKQINSIQR